MRYESLRDGTATSLAHPATALPAGETIATNSNPGGSRVWVLLSGRNLFKYQEIAPKAAKLARLGMGDPDIARQLGVDTRTVKRGREWVDKEVVD